jgi:hypothetical protein
VNCSYCFAGGAAAQQTAKELAEEKATTGFSVGQHAWMQWRVFVAHAHLAAVFADAA